MCYRSFLLLLSFPFFLFFFFNDTATTEIYTLSLHDALPISQACKGVVPLERKALHGGAQLTQQFLESCLLTAQPLETLRARVRLLLEAREHVAALRARMLELVQLRALLFFQLRELLILGSQLAVEFRETLQVVLDELDLPGARAPKVAVVGEHAAGERGILLVQEQLERLLAADEVSGAQLPGERRSVVLYLGFAHLLLGGERRAARGARGALAVHLAERIAQLPDRKSVV